MLHMLLEMNSRHASLVKFCKIDTLLFMLNQKTFTFNLHWNTIFIFQCMTRVIFHVLLNIQNLWYMVKFFRCIKQIRLDTVSLFTTQTRIWKTSTTFLYIWLLISDWRYLWNVFITTNKTHGILSWGSDVASSNPRCGTLPKFKPNNLAHEWNSNLRRQTIE